MSRSSPISPPYPDAMTDPSAFPESMRPLGAYVAKRCPLRVQLDIVLPVEQLPVAEDVQMRIDAGVVFEAALTGQMREAAQPGWVFIEEDSPTEEIRATEAAIDASAPLIVNARLPSDYSEFRSGAPDLLVWDVDGYVPIDIKHHKTLEEGHGARVSRLDDPFPRCLEEAPSGLRSRKDDALQLAHYQRMLEAMGAAASGSFAGIIGKECVVAWYDLDREMWTTPAKSGGKKRKRRTTMEAYDFEFEYRRDQAADAYLFRAGDTTELLPPVRISDCQMCGWKDYCDEVLQAGSGDASLLPNIGYRPWRALRTAGIRTREDVADLDYRTAKLGADGVDLGKWLDVCARADSTAPLEELYGRAKKQLQLLADAGISTAGQLVEAVEPQTAALDGAGFLPGAVLNARAAIGSDPVYVRPGVDDLGIPRADIELDVDMENAEDGVYLWGVLVTDRAESGLVDDGYLGFHSWDPLDETGEMAVFREFWAWLTGLLARAEQASVTVNGYCWYDPAENTQLRRIASRAPELIDEVESFIVSGAWVDLRKEFDDRWITGSSTSLKVIAPLAGFNWEVDDPGGGISMVRYQEAVSGDAAAQDWLLRYNRGDVEATLAIREWLDSERFQRLEIAGRT